MKKFWYIGCFVDPDMSDQASGLCENTPPVIVPMFKRIIVEAEDVDDAYAIGGSNIDKFYPDLKPLFLNDYAFPAEELDNFD